jgi:hypothetical protein
MRRPKRVDVAVGGACLLAVVDGCDLAHATCYDLQVDRAHLTGTLSIASSSGEAQVPVDVDESSDAAPASTGSYLVLFDASASESPDASVPAGYFSLTLDGPGIQGSLTLLFPPGTGTFSLRSLGACFLESPSNVLDAGPLPCPALDGQLVARAVSQKDCEPGWNSPESFGPICADTLAFDLTIDKGSAPIAGHLSLDYATEIDSYQGGFSCD